MCLSRILEQHDTPSAVITGGRKQFNGTDNKPKFASYALHGSQDVPLDQWIAADTSQKISASTGQYEAGFHVYDEDTKETNQAPYRLVFVRNISASGLEGSRKVVIAREMYVPSDPDGWPPLPGEPENKPPEKKGLVARMKNAVKPGNA
jgi:hypothetical protein